MSEVARACPAVCGEGRCVTMHLGDVLRGDPSIVTLRIGRRADCVTTGPVEVPVHKAVLMAASRLLAGMFGDVIWTEVRSGTADIPFDYDPFMIALQHMYGLHDVSSPLTPTNAVDVLAVATYYQLGALIGQAQMAVRGTFSTSSVPRLVHELQQIIDMAPLQTELMEHVCAHGLDVLGDAEWCAVPLETIERLLEEVADGSEEHVFRKCVEWAQHHTAPDGAVHDTLQPLLRYIDFSAMSIPHMASIRAMNVFPDKTMLDLFCQHSTPGDVPASNPPRHVRASRWRNAPPSNKWNATTVPSDCTLSAAHKTITVNNRASLAYRFFREASLCGIKLSTGLTMLRTLKHAHTSTLTLSCTNCLRRHWFRSFQSGVVVVLLCCMCVGSCCVIVLYV